MLLRNLCDRLNQDLPLSSPRRPAAAGTGVGSGVGGGWLDANDNDKIWHSAPSTQRCFTLDGWDLAFQRAEDSVDGRHYGYDSPTLNALNALFVSALGALTSQGSQAECCGVRDCNLE
eukprot:SAG11_NODE_2382_length_3425_cov_2.571257_1_plen_118_part_00